MHRQLKNPKFYLMVVTEAALLALALLLSYLVRFEFNLSTSELNKIQLLLIWIIPLKLTVFLCLGLYRGMWRYTGIHDIQNLAQATIISTLLIMAIILYLYRFMGYSRAVFLMDGVFTFLLSSGLRMFIRVFYGSRTQKMAVESSSFRKKHSKRVLIVGAGNAGEKILREIYENTRLLSNYKVIGFVDDDKEKQSRSVHGIKVLGTIAMLPRIVEEENVDEILIAIPSASGAEMRKIVDICKDCDVDYKTLPGIGEIIDGRVSVRALRDVNYEDLLGRPPVRLDIDKINNYLYDRDILITGCGGSIGSELCRQVVRFHPRSLILIDSSESNLFHIQMELQHEFYFPNARPILGHVQDQHLMNKVFPKYRPHVVFHAAAYKHVPMLEKNPWEAVFNNIIGTRTVLEATKKYDAERFVLISSDKAVRPTNVMGASKRVAELLVQSFQGNSTRFMTVRFGNVVGSSGSVVPLFLKQIERGGPVTVTRPEVTRYFMTIPEASQLILQAGAIGNGGELFVLEMGTPVRIIDMARDLIRLSGKEPDTEIKIIFTGLRDGEKLYEELITEGEEVLNTQHEKIMILKPKATWNGFDDPSLFSNWLNAKLDELCDAAQRFEANEVKDKLKDIVPEYSPQETSFVL